MDVAVVGGGASGMILASMFEKRNGTNLTIFEKNNKLGKKLLLTGNGKCNFTNDNFDDLDVIYNNDFAKALYKKYDNNSFIKYFESIGIEKRTEFHKNKIYYYPKSNKATSVYYNLLDKIEDNKINILYNNNVSHLDYDKNKKKFIVVANDKIFLFDRLILSTGGITYKKTGTNIDNFLLLAHSFNHHFTNVISGLNALNIKNSSDKFLTKAKSFRVECKVSCYHKFDGKDRLVYSEYGEVQFNGDIMSGIPILNICSIISRIIKDNYKSGSSFNANDFIKDFYISLDFLDVSESENINYNNKIFDINYLFDRKKSLHYKKIHDFLCGLIPNELIDSIFDRINKKCKIDVMKKVDGLNAIDIKNIYEILRNFEIKNFEYGSIDNGQITVGGIDVSEVDNTTMQSKKISGLYFIGEMLDIDGLCGGYNLQLCYSTARALYENFEFY